MTSRIRVLQVMYLAGLAAVANLASPPVAAAEKVVYCNICVAQCSLAEEWCGRICEAGPTISYQCWGNQTCTGAGGGTYAATVKCLVDVP